MNPVETLKIMQMAIENNRPYQYLIPVETSIENFNKWLMYYLILSDYDDFGSKCALSAGCHYVYTEHCIVVWLQHQLQHTITEFSDSE